MTSTTSRRIGDRSAARERLLDAADELFYEEGVHTVGIDRVIERAGVAKATLYNAFGSKEELVRAYLLRRLDARKARMADIKRAYKRLARTHHPDLNPGDRRAEETFKALNEAYSVLGDPARRKAYDRELEGAPTPRAPSGPAPATAWETAGFDPSSLGVFSSFFSDFSGSMVCRYFFFVSTIHCLMAFRPRIVRPSSSTEASSSKHPAAESASFPFTPSI